MKRLAILAAAVFLSHPASSQIVRHEIPALNEALTLTGVTELVPVANPPGQAVESSANPLSFAAFEAAFKDAKDPITKSDVEHHLWLGEGANNDPRAVSSLRDAIYQYILAAGEYSVTTGWGPWSKTLKHFRVIPMTSMRRWPEMTALSASQVTQAQELVERMGPSHSEPKFSATEVTFRMSESRGSAEYTLRKTGERLALQVEFRIGGQAPVFGYAILRKKLPLSAPSSATP
ncbi:MAG: hypothetical protein HY078_15495 [Elusimicrobia bacterium]|nr:hypothetical protein [Elusimicrobiota bacterium]